METVTLLNLLSYKERLQNSAGKNILKVPYDTNSHEVLERLIWFYLTERLFYHRSILTYKCLNGLTPEYLSAKFILNTNTYNTRSVNRRDLQIPKCKTTTGQRSFSYLGAKLWNSIDVRTRDCATLDCFKNRLKVDILAQRAQF